VRARARFPLALGRFVGLSVCQSSHDERYDSMHSLNRCLFDFLIDLRPCSQRLVV